MRCTRSGFGHLTGNFAMLFVERYKKNGRDVAIGKRATAFVDDPSSLRERPLTWHRSGGNAKKTTGKRGHSRVLVLVFSPPSERVQHDGVFVGASHRWLEQRTNRNRMVSGGFT